MWLIKNVSVSSSRAGLNNWRRAGSDVIFSFAAVGYDWTMLVRRILLHSYSGPQGYSARPRCIKTRLTIVIN